MFFAYNWQAVRESLRYWNMGYRNTTKKWFDSKDIMRDKDMSLEYLMISLSLCPWSNICCYKKCCSVYRGKRDKLRESLYGDILNRNMKGLKKVIISLSTPLTEPTVKMVTSRFYQNNP